MEYCALLRGINVGGKNRVEMSKLKEMMEALGFFNVSTYINSGNILFDSSSDEQIESIIAAGIASWFGLEILVIVIRKSELRTIMALVDDTYVNNTVLRCDVIFLSKSVNLEEFMSHMKVRDGIDTLLLHPRALIWRCDRSEASRSGLRKILQHPSYSMISIRNINTSRKLLQIMSQ